MSTGRGPRRYVVEPGAPMRLGEVLALLGEPRAALAEGRVFVGRRRARDASEPVVAGTSVEVRPARELSADAVLLAQTEGFALANKPPELPTEPDKSGLQSLRGRLAAELGVMEGTLHALSRLDVGVSGVVLFAKNPEARRQASELRADSRIRRRYVALTSATPSSEQGLVTAPVGGRPAETRYAVVARAERGIALCAFTPLTGRTHQLRIHAATLGAPLLGDRAHGGPRRLVTADGRVLELARIALHALWVELPEGRFAAPVPAELATLWREIGGDAAAWERAAED